MGMAGYIILGLLAAFGLLSALWAAFGWLLPGDGGWVVVRYGIPRPEQLARIRWLKSMGVLSCPVLIVAEAETAEADTEICSGEALLSRLEWERNRFDGTGNGDYPGHHQCGGVP
jgi:hypothetical protein